MFKPAFFAVSLFFWSLAHAQSPPVEDLERVLVPVCAAPTPGQSGSLWETELWVIADASNALAGPILNRECPPPTCGPPPPPPPPAHEAFKPAVFRTYPGENSGILLYVRRSLADDVTFSLRVADVSRRALSEGVSIPIVRERDLIRGRPAHLLNIPVRASSRIRLRVYDPFLTPNPVVVVRVYRSSGTDLLIHEETLALRQPGPHPDLLWPLPLQPATGETGIRTDFPGAAEGDVLRIEISPASPDLAFWAFATMTNNLNNEVTITTAK